MDVNIPAIHIISWFFSKLEIFERQLWLYICKKLFSMSNKLPSTDDFYLVNI